MCRNDHNLQVSTTYGCVLYPVKFTARQLMKSLNASHKRTTDRDREKERIEKKSSKKLVGGGPYNHSTSFILDDHHQEHHPPLYLKHPTVSINIYRILGPALYHRMGQDWLRYIRSKPKTTIQPPVKSPVKVVEIHNPDFLLDSRGFAGAELFAESNWTEEVVVMLNHKISEDVFGFENADGEPSGIKELINLVSNCRLLKVDQAVFALICAVLQPHHDLHVMTGIDLIPRPKETVASDLIVWQSIQQGSTS
ncbi:hypothetical protein ABEF91_004463 [Exophiala dermatitidis]